MIGRKVIIQFFGLGISSFLSFFIISLTARFFGASILGEVNYFLGVLGLFLIFSDFGFSRAHVKFIAGKKNFGKKIGVFISIKTILLIISFIAAFCHYYFFLRQASSFWKNLSFIILLLNEILFRLGSAILLTFEGLQRVTTVNTILTVGKFFKLLGLVLAILFLKNLLGLSLSYLFEGIIVFILALAFIRKFFPLSWDSAIFRQYFRYSLPFFVILPFSYLQGNIDVVILKKFWQASEVGYYSIALGLTAFLKSLYGVSMTLFFPEMSQLFSHNKMQKIKDYTDLTIKYLCLLFIPIYLGLYFFSKEIILLILGKNFSPSINIFSLSLVSLTILMISAPFDYILYATGKHKVLAPLTVSTVVLSIILQMILVPKSLFGLTLFGMAGQGTVLANSLAWFLWLVAQLFIVYKLFKIKINLKILPVLAYGLISVIIFSLLKINNLSFSEKFLFLIIDLFTFYLLTRSTKIIDSQDLKYLKIILNPRKIIEEAGNDISNKN